MASRPPKVGKYRADIKCMVTVPTTFGVFLGGCFVHMFYFHPDPWGNDPI